MGCLKLTYREETTAVNWQVWAREKGENLEVSGVDQASGGIDNTFDAVTQYLFGDGSPQAIGPNTTRSLMNTETFRDAHNDILRGKRGLSGRFGVDMTDIVFHIGRTPVSYTTDLKNQTITYTLYEGDGFWDVDFIDERYGPNTPAGKAFPDFFRPDGPGPNLERFGGTPYGYIPTVVTVPLTLMIFPYR
ncbi:MAG: hypothetical protein HRT61_12160 [Ekhidna sp.]|nr:hypothetical protein [Ekhidna sp.]